MEQQIQVNRVYRHFKGNYYYIVAIANHSETKERMVIYRPLYPRTDSTVWVRPENMFFEPVPKERPDNITGQTQRFLLVEDLSNNYIL